jgi:hypothetical protein
MGPVVVPVESSVSVVSLVSLPEASAVPAVVSLVAEMELLVVSEPWVVLVLEAESEVVSPGSSPGQPIISNPEVRPTRLGRSEARMVMGSSPVEKTSRTYHGPVAAPARWFVTTLLSDRVHCRCAAAMLAAPDDDVSVQIMIARR